MRYYKITAVVVAVEGDLPSTENNWRPPVKEIWRDKAHEEIFTKEQLGYGRFLEQSALTLIERKQL